VLEQLAPKIRLLHDEISKVIVGQQEIISAALYALFSRGHCLLVGVPGLAKTLLVHSLARSLELPFSRIQFTPDLMPSDITGTEILEEDTVTGHRRFVFARGPVFTQVLLADEINRTPPKTQAALLEAMQEHSVTVAGKLHRLDEPFFVLATQNPLEQEGTYPLPEAQLDRFLFKILVPFPTLSDLSAIIDRTTGTHTADVQPALDGGQVMSMQRLARAIVVEGLVKEYALKLVLATHPNSEHAPEAVRRFVRYG